MNITCTQHSHVHNILFLCVLLCVSTAFRHMCQQSVLSHVSAQHSVTCISIAFRHMSSHVSVQHSVTCVSIAVCDVCKCAEPLLSF